MRRLLIPIVLLFVSSGCCCGGKQYTNTCKPPMNCMGSAYDGSSAPCYHPPGPFWCCLPGPCSTCRDPYVRYYEEQNANCIGRHVCQPDYAVTTDSSEE
jgi:hypothetical protein